MQFEISTLTYYTNSTLYYLSTNINYGLCKLIPAVVFIYAVGISSCKLYTYSCRARTSCGNCHAWNLVSVRIIPEVSYFAWCSDRLSLLTHTVILIISVACYIVFITRNAQLLSVSILIILIAVGVCLQLILHLNDFDISCSLYLIYGFWQLNPIHSPVA